MESAETRLTRLEERVKNLGDLLSEVRVGQRELQVAVWKGIGAISLAVVAAGLVVKFL